MVSTPTVAYAAARRKRPPAAQRKFRLFFRRINRKFFSKSLLPFLTPVNKENIRAAHRAGLKTLVFSLKIG